MKVGDRVTMSPMWKYSKAVGTVSNITKTYVVVAWDGVNGEWHYTEQQAKHLKLVEHESNKEASEE